MSIQLKCKDPGNAEGFLEIMDLSGRKVLSRKIETGKQFEMEWDMAGLSQGVYLIRSVLGTCTFSEKIVKR